MYYVNISISLESIHEPYKMQEMALKCPFCDHEGMPIIEKKMTETGWVIFVLLVIFCLPLCWIPFVVDGTKEEIRKCANCGSRLG
jgi:hypothetical protein